MKLNIEDFYAHPNVFHKEWEDLVIFCYTRECQYDRIWDDVTRHARGIIFNKVTGEVVGRPWRKWWNLLEEPTPPLSELRGLKFTATEKMDGSLGIMIPYKGQWYVTTKGAFGSDQAAWATDWARKHINFDAVPKGYTTLYEIIYPENQIVVKYGDREEMVLLGVVSNETGEELPYEDLKPIAKDLGVTLVPVIESSELDELQKIAKTLDSNKEGFVVTFENGIKVKIKGDEYCRVHKLIAYMTPLAFWDMWDYEKDFKNPGISKEFLSQLPEEFREECDALKEVIDELHWNIWDNAKDDYEEAAKHVDPTDHRALAQYAFSNFGKLRANYVMKYTKCIQTENPHAYWKFWFSAHQAVRPTYNKLPEGDKFERLNRIKMEG